METKVCLSCKQEKNVEEFPWWVKAKNRRKPRCNPCQKEYLRRYRKENKTNIRARQEKAIASRRKKVREGLITESDTKICNDCGVFKKVSEFRWQDKSSLRRHSRCTECDALHRSGYYKENKQLFIEGKKRQFAKLRKLLNEYKDVPCTDCGVRYPPYVMDFDHLDPTSKIMKVSALIFVGSEPILLDEIAKCEVVCSNCHRIRTHNRKEEARVKT